MKTNSAEQYLPLAIVAIVAIVALFVMVSPGASLSDSISVQTVGHAYDPTLFCDSQGGPGGPEPGGVEQCCQQNPDGTATLTNYDVDQDGNLIEPGSPILTCLYGCWPYSTSCMPETVIVETRKPTILQDLFQNLR